MISNAHACLVSGSRLQALFTRKLTRSYEMVIQERNHMMLWEELQNQQRKVREMQLQHELSQNKLLQTPHCADGDHIARLET